MSKEILIKKVTKGGFGRKVNSEFGYASFDIVADSIEVHIDPPIDLATEEGRADYVKLQKGLDKMMMEQLENATTHYRDNNDELDMSLKKRDSVVQKAKGNG